jgi:rhodanese-related sulfurtransferase
MLVTHAGKGTMRSPCRYALAAVLGAATLAACGKDRAQESAAVVRAAAPAYADVTATQLHDMMQVQDLVLINVHIPYAGDIPGTDLSIPFDRIAANVDRLPADKAAKVVVYCRSGRMSVEASEALVALGYRNVSNVVGGLKAWSEAGYPLELRGQP